MEFNNEWLYHIIKHTFTRATLTVSWPTAWFTSCMTHVTSMGRLVVEHSIWTFIDTGWTKERLWKSAWETLISAISIACLTWWVAWNTAVIESELDQNAAWNSYMSEIVILAVWFQLKQLKKQPKKNSGLNGTWTHDLAIPVHRRWIDGQLWVANMNIWMWYMKIMYNVNCGWTLYHFHDLAIPVHRRWIDGQLWVANMNIWIWYMKIIIIMWTADEHYIIFIYHIHIMWTADEHEWNCDPCSALSYVL